MKVAIIYSFEESNWFSCTIINKNLRLAYEEEFGKENIVEINYSEKGIVSTADLNKITEQNIEKLVFIDHKPTPLCFLNRLKSVEGELSTQREYIIHVFGDFPLYLGEWKFVHEILINYSVKYICASQKQKKLIEKFSPQTDLVFVSPVPVDSEKFNCEHKTITPCEKWGVSPSDKIVLYTGRISLQKRIKEALEIFFECLKEKRIPVNSKFLIVGEFDLLGSVYLGYSQLQGEYFLDIYKVIAKY
jgi:glycosyltransferase involved in cell wall biosynthesis